MSCDKKANARRDLYNDFLALKQNNFSKSDSKLQVQVRASYPKHAEV